MTANHYPFASPLPHKSSLPRGDHCYQFIVYYSSICFLWHVCIYSVLLGLHTGSF